MLTIAIIMSAIGLISVFCAFWGSLFIPQKQVTPNDPIIRFYKWLFGFGFILVVLAFLFLIFKC